MIKLDLRDPRLTENYEAIKALRKLGQYSDEEIQQMYNKQIEADKEAKSDLRRSNSPF